LNPEYDHVRVQTLGKEKAIGIIKVVTIIQSEESRRGLMLVTPTTENSTMIVERRTPITSHYRKSWVPNLEKEHEKVCCTYCNKPCHTRKTQ